MYEHKKYYSSIAFTASDIEDTELNREIDRKVQEARNCLGHAFDYLHDWPYRLYRRGKNRCKVCGRKIND